MIRSIFSLLIVMIGIGCAAPTPPSPDLSEDELVRIIADLHMAEVAAKKVHAKQKEEILTGYYRQVFKIHHISKAEFEKQFAILQQNPDLLTEVYKQALEYVTIMSKEQ